jgi:hypothetical protein
MTEKEFLKIFEREEAVVAQSVARLSRAVSEKILLIFERQANRLKDVLKTDAKGNLIMSDSVFKVLLEIEKEILAEINSDSEFNKPLLSEFAVNADSVTGVEKEMHLKINDINIDKASAEIGVWRKLLADEWIFLMKENGVKQALLPEFKRTIYAAVANNWSYSTLARKLKQEFTGKNDKLEKAAARTANDAIRGFQGGINAAVQQRFNLPYYYYSGSLVSESRPFCKHVINVLKRYIEVNKLPVLLKSFLSDPIKSQGMFQGTNADNFAKLRGGNHCYHLAFAMRKKSI